MAILGRIIKKSINLKENLEELYTSPFELQKQELRNLLIYCKDTKFGREYSFDIILDSFRGDKNDFYTVFKKKIPVFEYEKIYQEWWYKVKEGKTNICWPGKINHFALSSGTSNASSKYIPITSNMLKSNRKTSLRQLLILKKYNLPASFFLKGMLVISGSTDLKKKEHYYEGDTSGITASTIPFWLKYLYKPGDKIAKIKDWNTKLDEIVKNAPKWDIGIIIGVPSWLQILIESIIKEYKLKTIHDIWPNLQVFIHGGVSFEPYKRGFEKFLAKSLIYMETYLASEGFLAFQAYPNRRSMRLVLNGGIFYEFVLFIEENFDEDGKIRPNAETLNIDEVEENKEYALLITTNAGAWRYLIGDVIKFTSIEESEIIITGRTQLFMNLCGEHLSLDNMNKCIENVVEELKIDVREFTLLGECLDNKFMHHWFIGTDDPVDIEQLKEKIDYHLKKLNDDYGVEREYVLKEIKITVLPSNIFYKWMETQGKIGNQNKFPRVLKKKRAELWKLFLQNHDINLS